MSLIIRFRSKNGQFRLNATPITAFGDLMDELIVSKLPKSTNTNSISVKFPNGNSYNADDIKMKTLDELMLRNGDMLVLDYSSDNNASVPTANMGKSISGKVMDTVSINNTITASKQSPLDDELDRDSGFIPRKKGSLCKHNDQGMCEYCSPLPPWDREYQLEHNIKHISFHSHVKELNSHVNKGDSSYISPLKPSDFSINKKCPSGHEPWPRGICSKCQPSAITLQRQEFRMVDHVEFVNSEIVNDFINCWRLSGGQRIGLLLGKYARYDKIPLGIKCSVEAIYEFPQIDKDDGIILQNWEDEDKVLELSRSLGLQPVGIIFTDLSDSGRGDGSVICKRHVNSFFLSSLEILFAVKWQLKFANRCKWSETGEFSSKFVTCVVSGNTNGEIEVNAYQASEAAEALVKADLISPSTHPDQMFIKETTDKRYVPDIFYQKINEYGLQVKHNAKPSFPVEFLVVSLTHGFPDQEKNNTKPFTVENRAYIGQTATIASLQNHFVSGFSTSPDPAIFLYELSNWHLLYYILYQLDVLSPTEKDAVCGAVASQNGNLAATVAVQAGWKTLETLSSL